MVSILEEAAQIRPLEDDLRQYRDVGPSPRPTPSASRGALRPDSILRGYRPVAGSGQLGQMPNDLHPEATESQQNETIARAVRYSPEEQVDASCWVYLGLEDALV